MISPTMSLGVLMHVLKDANAHDLGQLSKGSRGLSLTKQNLEDDEQRDVADDLNIDAGNSAREAVVGNPHQRADEAERKGQGEASALISTVRKAPQPSAGKQGISTRRLRPERPTVRRLLSHSTAFRRRFDKGGHRRIAEPFDP